MKLPTWEEIAEAVKMPGGIVSVTLFNGTTIDLTSEQFRRIVEAGVKA